MNVVEAAYGTRWPFIGVVMVRNKLIEHAEKPDGVMPINWQYDYGDVLLKPFAAPSRQWADAGLRRNARELHYHLVTRLNVGSEVAASGPVEWDWEAE